MRPRLAARPCGFHFERTEQRSPLVGVEPMTGIEPAYSAWEADVLPLNYIGMVPLQDINPGR